MKKSLMIFLLLANSVSYADEFLPGDAAKGEALHNQNCVACHDSSVYTRASRIQSLGGLQKRVKGCSEMLKKDFGKEDQENIVKYLNEKYYQFKSE